MTTAQAFEAADQDRRNGRLRRDLTLGRDPRAQALAIADNRASELDLAWDPALACPRRLRLIALIDDPAVIARILGHLGVPPEIPEARPARAPPRHLPLEAPVAQVARDPLLGDDPA